jgi:hypothetical protein
MTGTLLVDGKRNGRNTDGCPFDSCVCINAQCINCPVIRKCINDSPPINTILFLQFCQTLSQRVFSEYTASGVFYTTFSCPSILMMDIPCTEAWVGKFGVEGSCV